MSGWQAYLGYGFLFGVFGAVAVTLLMTSLAVSKILSDFPAPCGLETISERDVLTRAQTGDLVFTMAMGALGVPVVDRLWQHVGLIWHHPVLKVPCVIESQSLRGVLSSAEFDESDGVLRGRGLRVVPLAKYLSSPSRLVSVVGLVGESAEDRRRVEQAFSVCGNKDYHPGLEQMSGLMYTSLGVHMVYSDLGAWLAKTSGMQDDEPYTFCSRFVLDVYYRAGLLALDECDYLRKRTLVSPPQLQTSLHGWLRPGLALTRQAVITQRSID